MPWCRMSEALVRIQWKSKCCHLSHSRQSDDSRCCGVLQNPHVQLQNPGAAAAHSCPEETFFGILVWGEGLQRELRLFLLCYPLASVPPAQPLLPSLAQPFKSHFLPHWAGGGGGAGRHSVPASARGSYPLQGDQDRVHELLRLRHRDGPVPEVDQRDFLGARVRYELPQLRVLRHKEGA